VTAPAVLITMNGYAAVQAVSQIKGARADCVVIVDVADGQSVQAEYAAPAGRRTSRAVRPVTWRVWR
jgi:hypothetical protein